MDENAVAVVSEERSVAEVKAQINKVQALMKECLIEDTHYGPSFPGDTKKNLLQPGADKLCFLFRLAPEFQYTVSDLPGGHREFITKCQLRSMTTGTIAGEGLGSCSTMESKYRWRSIRKKCPACGAEAIIQGKAEYGGGWICFAKKGGCGAKYEESDDAIVSQPTGKMENPDIADVYNTVLKMSNKRAYVAAAIKATAVSDMFTQDIEDLVEPEVRNVTPKKETKPKPDPKDEPPMKKVNGTPITEGESPEVAALRIATEAIASRMTTARDDLKAIMSDQLFTADEKAIADKKRKALDMDGTTVLFNEKNAAFLESLVKEYRDKLSAKIEALAGPAPEVPVQENLDPLKDEAPLVALPLASAIGKLKASAEAQRQEVPPAETKTTEQKLDIF